MVTTIEENIDQAVNRKVILRERKTGKSLKTITCTIFAMAKEQCAQRTLEWLLFLH